MKALGEDVAGVGQPDVQGSNASLQREVERIRAALLERHGYMNDGELLRGISRSPVEDVARLARVSAHWGIASDIQIFGRFLVFFRRLLRLALRWYINPIVDQQNAFNEAAVHALYDLYTENENLRAEMLRVRQVISGSEENAGQ